MIEIKRQLKIEISAIIFFSIISAILQLLMPVVINKLINISNNIEELHAVVYSLILIFFLRIILSSLNKFISSKTSQKVTYWLISLVLGSKSNLTYNRATLIREDATSLGGVVESFGDILMSIVILIVTLAFISVREPLISIASLLLLFLSSILMLKLRKMLDKTYQNFLESDQSYKNKFIQYLNSEGGSHFEAQELYENSTAIFKYEALQKILFGVPQIVIGLILFCFIGYLFVYQFDYLVSNIVLILSYLGMLAMSISVVVNNSVTIFRARSNYKRINEAMRLTT